MTQVSGWLFLRLTIFLAEWIQPGFESQVGSRLDSPVWIAASERPLRRVLMPSGECPIRSFWPESSWVPSGQTERHCQSYAFTGSTASFLLPRASCLVTTV